MGGGRRKSPGRRGGLAWSLVITCSNVERMVARRLCTIIESSLLLGGFGGWI